MDILYRRGRATAVEVMEDLSGDPSYSTGLRYVYMPAVPRHAARKSALRHSPDVVSLAARISHGQARGQE